MTPQLPPDMLDPISPEDLDFYKAMLNMLKNTPDSMYMGDFTFLISDVKNLTEGGTEPLRGVVEKVYNSNGEVREFVRVVKETAVGSGIFAGTKYALTGISMPALSALAIPAFGIAGGKLLYDTFPDFWDARASELEELGLMIGDFVTGLFDGEDETVYLPEETILNIRDHIPKTFFDTSLNISVKANFDINNSYYTQYNSIPQAFKYLDSVKYYENIPEFKVWYNYVNPKQYAIFTPLGQYDFVTYNIGLLASNKKEYVIRSYSVFFSTTENIKLRVYNSETNITTEVNSNYSLWYMPSNKPAYRIYVYSFFTQIGYSDLNFNIKQWNMTNLSGLESNEIFDGVNAFYYISGKQYDLAYSEYMIVPIMLSAKTGFKYEDGVVEPTSGTLAENYPDWKTTALDAVNSGLQKGYAIGINPITEPTLSPLEKQQAQQNPSSMTTTTINPEQWDALLKALTNMLNVTVTTPNPNPNPDTQTQPSTQPLPKPGGDIGTPPKPPNPNEKPKPGNTPIIPILPSSMQSNALFTVYNPSVSQLNQLGNFLWSIWNGTNPIENIIEIFMKIWQNPLDGVISLTRVYANVPSSYTSNIYLGAIDTSIPCPVVTQQFISLNMGRVNVSEILKNVTDYSPYCSVNVFLPFIGYVEVDSDDFMAGQMEIDYNIDVWTGACLATIYSVRNPDMPSKTPLYTFSGNVCQQIPLTSMSANGIMSGLVSATAGLLTGASGGALASIAAGTVSHQLVHVSRSGSISGNAGILGSKTPGIVISRRNSYDANAYNTLYGFPSNETVYLNNCSGFTKVKHIHLKSYATSAEKEEIVAKLKEGVII